MRCVSSRVGTFDTVGDHGAGGLVQSGQEMRRRVLAGAGPTHGLAVHRDHPATVDGAGACAQPGPQVGINVSGVQVLQNPADGRLRRKILPRLQSQGLQVGGGQVGGVLPYRSQAATAGQHSGDGQGQDHRQASSAHPDGPWDPPRP